jgi:DNA-binding XRE family transcriptional regulator
MEKILKNDRDRSQCRDELAKWHALSSHVRKITRSFGLEEPRLFALIDDHIQSLNGQLARYEALTMETDADTSNGVFELLRQIRKLPAALIEARVALGWSQDELAEKAVTKRQQICRYENELYASIRMGNAIELAQLLEQEAANRWTACHQPECREDRENAGA